MKYNIKNNLAIIKFRLKKLYYRFGSHKLFSGVRRFGEMPKWARNATLIVIALVIFLGGWQFLQGRAQAKLITFTKDDYFSGTSDFSTIQLGPGGNSIGLQKGSVGQWNGQTSTGLQSLQTNNYGFTNMVYGPNNTLYIMTAFATNCFFKRYDIEVKTYKSLNTPPVDCGTGNILQFDNSGSFYYIPGGSASIPSDRFFRYDIADDSWHEISSLPTQVSSYSSGLMVTQGSKKYLYVFRGMSSASFWRYSITDDLWENMPSFPTSAGTTYGIVTAWDGSNTIYALGNHTGEFRKYDIISKTWTNLTTVTGSGYNFHSLQYINGNILAMRLNWSSNAPSLRSYNVGSGIWTDLPVPPTPANYYDLPISLAYDGSRYLYTMVQSDFRPDLYRYDLTNNTWNGSSLLNTAIDSSAGAAHGPIYDGTQSVYYFGGTLGSYYGSYSDRLFKYDLVTKTVSRINTMPNSRIGWDGAYYSGAANGNIPSLYVLSMTGNTYFSRYDLSNDTLTSLAAMPFTASTAGTDIIDGGDGYLYVSFAGGRTNFSRYNIATDTWETLTTMPFAPSDGSGMARIGSSIYVLVGAQSGRVIKYDMVAKTWTTLLIPSGGVSYGAFIASDQARYLYIGASNRTDNVGRMVYQYDTQTSTWQRMANTPTTTKAYANSFFDVTNNKLYVTQGQIEASIWDWSPNVANYVVSGTWYSKIYDLTQVSSWQSLQYTKSGTGTVVAYTRSSANGNIWGDWQQVSGNSISSSPNRYLQLKFVLSGDGTTTPVVSDISINHLQETVAPNLPSQFTAKDKKDGTTLISGNNYEAQHPYFSWNAADDGANGSGVSGYYIYYGTNSSADPVTDGSFQTDTNYTVTTPMSSGEVYYFKMKIKDNVGNVTSSATFFSYVYAYISPPGSVIKTSDSDFSQGINTSVSINNGSMKLSQSADGAWSTGPMAMPPDNVQGAAQKVIGDYLYIARGAGTNIFWRYNLINQSWDVLNTIPGTVSLGSSMVYDGSNFIYLIAGGGTTNFYKYNISTGAWSVMSPLPTNAQAGSDMAYLGNGKIAILFTSVREFYLYDIATNVASPATTYPGVISESGSGIWYDGKDTIYAYLGSYDWNSSGYTRNNMVKYSLESGDWKVLANPPVMANYNQNNLVSDGQGNLYVFDHNQSDNLDKRQRVIKYNIASDSWSEVPGLEDQVYYGSITSDEKRYIYILPAGNGTSSRKIIRYDTWNKDFTPKEKGVDVMQKVPYDSHINGWQWVGGQASTAAYDGNRYIYALGGNEATSNWMRFMKYDYKTGETIYLAQPPTAGIGGSLAYLDGQLFYMPAKSTKEFYKFDETLNQWISMADLPVVSYRPGPSSLVAISGSIYAFIGNGTAFYKYTPNSTTGVWSAALAVVPGSYLNGSAVYDPTTNAIFLIRGNGTTGFYRYDVAANTWSTKAVLPASSSYGSTMVISNGMIYAQIGNAIKSSYIYNISSNTWRAGVAAPELFRYGSQALNVSNDYAIYFAGESSPDIWQFNYPDTDKAYKGLAVHESQSIPISGLFDYANISAQVTLPANTNVELWTRSSADNVKWDDWVISKNVKYYSGSMVGSVMSKPQKYTQVRIVMESDDNLYSPTVDSYALNYYFDVDPPQNPQSIKVYSDSTKATEVSNNTWYLYPKPLFDWPGPGQPGGASDGDVGSRIAGYWVYIGTDPTASPRSAGTFVTDTKIEANLTVSGSYYILIQAQDMTGNVDGNIYSPFIYRFDNDPPTNPSMVSAMPSGFTAKNVFTFEWPNSFDGQSGIAGYCYHTGANSGPFSAEICQSGTSLTNIPAAYQAGTNVMYIRTYDIAGNYSKSYTTISYYYSTDPPGPVTNLYASPSSSTDNMFRFVWSLPVTFSGNPESLTYCYSINVLPSPLNTTCQPQITSTSTFKAATQQGTNIIYMVAKDEAGNINWNNFASANFIANTISPGIPLNLSVTDTSDRVSGRWALTSTWDEPTFKGNGIKEYIVERSDDGHTFYRVGTTSTRAFVDLDVKSESTYYYRIFAADNVDNRGGASAIVSRTAQGNFSTPPLIVVQPLANAGFDQADISWATGRASTSFVYYGLSPNSLDQSKGSLDLITSHNQSISGLQPSTTYYYRVQSFDNDRSYPLNDAYSPIYNFRTTEEAQVFEVTTSDVTSSTAIISWKTSAPTRARIDYGPSLDYGISLDDSNPNPSTSHMIKLTGLTSGEYYHYRIVSTTEYGSRLNSDDYLFKTIERPQISDVRFQPIDSGASSGVKVTWITNVPTSSTVQYDALGVRLEAGLSELVTNHEIVLKDLASSTDYNISVLGRDQYGSLAQTSNQVWQSQLDTRPPEISNLNYSVNVTESTKGKRAQIIVTWNTDEPATSQLSFGLLSSSELSNKTPVNTDPATSHVAIISDLNLADIYKVQAVSRDLNGNVSYGVATTVVTPDKEVSVFDSVLNLMLKLFRF